MLSVKEFYEWACSVGLEDCNFGISVSDDNKVALANGISKNDIETCVEVNKNDIEIGSYYDYGDGHKAQKKFIWINKTVGDLGDC